MLKFLVIISLLILTVVSPPALGQGGLDQRVAELSQQIAKEMTEYQKTTIAVVEFSDLQGNVTDFGRFLAEKLITRLYQTKKFKVIERQLLKKVISEQKISLTGMVDPSSAKQLGKLLGVDAICSGTVTDLAQSLDVNARLINAETGEIFAVASTEIFKDESVIKLMAAGTSVPTPSPKPAITSKSSIQKVESNGFTFELKKCKMSGTKITCELFITNIEDDKQLMLYNWSWSAAARIFDDMGNEYRTERAQLGNIESTGPNNSLVSGVPTKARFSFEKVQSEASEVKLLEIGCRSRGNQEKDFTAQIRNIPITK